MKSAKKVREALEAPDDRKPIPDDAWLSTGITPLNLAISHHRDRGIPKGKYVYFVGASESGKTIIGIQLFAEAERNPNFKDYRLVYDGSENGLQLDVAKFFNKRVADRIEPPKGTRDDPRFSRTTREFYYNLYDCLEDGRPFIYFLDSMDGLDTEEDLDKFKEEKTAFEKGKDAGGSYGVSQAKTNSRNIKRMVSRLEETGSILIVVSQTRDKINAHQFEKKDTRAGGKALRFFSHVELWTRVGAKVKAKYNKTRERVVGSEIVIDVEKNRINGFHGRVSTVFYRQSGFDDVGACVSLLIDEGFWPKSESGVVNAVGLGLKGTKEKLIRKIMDQNEEPELRLACERVWLEIEEKCRVPRKHQYE